MEIEIYIYVYNALECTQHICLLIFKTWKIAVMFPGLLSGPIAWFFVVVVFIKIYGLQVSYFVFVCLACLHCVTC